MIGITLTNLAGAVVNLAKLLGVDFLDCSAGRDEVDDLHDGQRSMAGKAWPGIDVSLQRDLRSSVILTLVPA